LHRLNLNAPITIEWRPLRCLASRPELNTAIAVFIIEAAAAAPSAADLVAAAGRRGRNARRLVPLNASRA
jgi:hypothetical protein